MAAEGGPSGAVSLRDVAQQYLATEVFSVAGGEPYVLVLDSATLPLVSSTFSLFEPQPPVLERLDSNRQQMPEVQAIYFLDPNERSFSRMLQDFRELEGDVSQVGCCERLLYLGMQLPKVSVRMYKSVHLVTTRPLTESQEKRLAENEMLHTYLKFRKVAEVPAQVLERSVFSLDMPRAALPLYGNHAGADKVMNRIARRLLQMCVLMKERPHIRFRKDSWIRRVAEILHRMLEEYAIAHPTMEWASPRATMLLIDRKEDVVAPLLHEYTYQAAFEYHASLKNGQSKTRKVALNENNDLWVHFRHGSVSHALKELNRMLVELNEGEGDARDLTSKPGLDAVRHLKSHLEAREMHAQHQAMVQAIQAEFKKRSLYDVAEVEQTIATGVTRQGDPVTKDEAEKHIHELLMDENPTPADKARLVATYLASFENADASMRTAFENTVRRVPTSLKNALVNLSFMGVTLAKPAPGAPGAGRPEMPPPQLRARAKVDAEVLTRGAEGKRAHFLTRYRPVLLDTLNMLSSNALPRDLYPYVEEPKEEKPEAEKANEAPKVASLVKSARTKGRVKLPQGAAGAAEEKRESSPVPTKSARTIVFIGGGACYSELRSVYELSEQMGKEVILGTTSVLSPEDYLDLLSKMDPELIPKKRGKDDAAGAVGLRDVSLS